MHFPVMTMLDKFMKRSEWTDQRLADLVGRDRTTISRIRRGEAQPSLEVALKIEQITNGKVPAWSFLPEATYPAPQSGARTPADGTRLA